MEQIKDTPAQIIADPNISYDEIIEQLPFKPAPRISEAGEPPPITPLSLISYADCGPRHCQ